MDIGCLMVSGALTIPGIAGAIIAGREFRRKKPADFAAEAARSICSAAAGISGYFRSNLSDGTDNEPSGAAGKIYRKTVGRFVGKEKEKKADTEIFNGIGYIRNRIMSSGGVNINTDNIIEELLAGANVLKPAYLRMLALIHVNDIKGAAEEFERLSFSGHGREFARILIQLDETGPGEMYEALKAFQKSINEKRITELRKTDEMMSNLLYLPVVLNLVIIFFNFIYTAYFMQQQEMLGMLVM